MAPSREDLEKISSLLREGQDAAYAFLERDIAKKCARIKALRPKSPLGVVTSSPDIFLNKLDGAIHHWLSQNEGHRKQGSKSSVPKPPYDEKLRAAQLNIHIKRILIRTLGDAATLALRITSPSGGFNDTRVSVGEDPAEQQQRFGVVQQQNIPIRVAAEHAENLALTSHERGMIHQCGTFVKRLREIAYLPIEETRKFYPLTREKHQQAMAAVDSFGGFIKVWETHHGITRTTTKQNFDQPWSISGDFSGLAASSGKQMVLKPEGGQLAQASNTVPTRMLPKPVFGQKPLQKTGTDHLPHRRPHKGPDKRQEKLF